MIPLLLIVTAAISYLLGGVNGAIIISKYIFRKDVRNYGSGNAGLTNFHRTFGAGWAGAVIAVDVLKAVISILIGAGLMSTVGHPFVGKVFAGFCVMMGHTFPVYYNFRGGKGVLCAGAMILMLDWRVGIFCWSVFILVVIFTRYVSLGSIISCICGPLGIWIAGHGWLEGLLTLFCVLLVIYNHRSNIVRLINHKESKLKIGKDPGKRLMDDKF